MKTLAAALFAAAMVVPVVASASSWDPVESELTAAPAPANPANIAAAACGRGPPHSEGRDLGSGRK